MGKRFWALAILVATVCAQTAAHSAVSQLDSTIAGYLTKISAYASDGTKENVLVKTNQQLKAFFKKKSQDPALLKDSLEKSQESGLTAAASSDGKFRVYSWDKLTGGTMHFYDGLIQYNAGGGKMGMLDLGPKENGDTGSWYKSVKTFKTNDNQTVYVVYSSNSYSNQEHARAVQAYAIQGGKLVTYKLFDTGKKKLDSISYSMTNLEWNDKGEVQFDQNDKRMRIPVIGKDGQITGRFLDYRFDGSRFLFTPSAKK